MQQGPKQVPKANLLVKERVVGMPSMLHFKLPVEVPEVVAVGVTSQVPQVDVRHVDKTISSAQTAARFRWGYPHLRASSPPDGSREPLREGLPSSPPALGCGKQRRARDLQERFQVKGARQCLEPRDGVR